MACWEYTLTCFGDFLEQRRLAFTEPMPPSRICSMCGRVPSGTALLPCGHVLCGECQGEVLDRMECPFEGKAFTKGQLVRLRFELSDVEQLPVVCMIGGSKCGTFSGKLFELKDHMRQCRSIDVQCVKCHRSIASKVAVEHYRQCHTERVPRRKSTDVRVQRAIEEVQRIKEDLQTLRQQSLGGQHVDDDLVNGTNGLVEKLVCLNRALSKIQNISARAGHEPCPLSLGIAPGPFRTASKPGVFITSCKFSNVCATRDTLNGSNKECIVSSEICTLAGYTFRVYCIFLLTGKAENEEVNVSFRLHLKSGDWDEHVEWPFTKKVTFILAHPTDATKDIRLTSVMDGYKLTRKPRLNEWNWRRKTENTSWKDIELQGFVVKDALYVNVEFE
uniref:Putative tumor necrosis factor receptor ovary overexpressed n=1 Tax=Rhipicephalus microplus TaxID=6941 RepID=A0A6M2D013_RHIMP